MSPRSWRARNNTFKNPSRAQTDNTLDAGDYFVSLHIIMSHVSFSDTNNILRQVGPRDMAKHSKWPFFLRMHGSVLPKMILPLIVVAIWSTIITVVSQIWYELKVSSLLLTVLGFVVGLAISFRTSSAYERYTEGRRYWSQMLFVAHNLARTIWIHAEERPGELGKQDLLNKVYAHIISSRQGAHKLII
jgi:putative membrane protein